MYYNAELIDIHKVRALVSQDPTHFIILVKKTADKQGILDAIGLIKVSGICFSIYGENKYSALLQEAIDVLIFIFGEENEEIQRLKSEIGLLKELFYDFRDLMSELGVDNLASNSPVCHFLVGCENVVGAIVEFTWGLDWEEVARKYPLAQRPKNCSGEKLDPKKDWQQLSEMYESFVSYVGDVFKYFNYRGFEFAGSNNLLLKENLDLSIKLLKLYDLFSRLSSTYENWICLDCVLRKEGNQIWFYPREKESFLARQVSLFRFNHLNHQRAIEWSKILEKKSYDPPSRGMLPEGARSAEEAMSAILCADFFGSYRLEEKVMNVALSVWIRAFTIIKEIVKTKLKSRSIGLPFSVKDWCLLKDASEWIAEFMRGGIEEQDAGVIISNLTFTREALDIFDCPLVKFEEKLLCLPAASVFIDPAQSLMANFCRKGVDVSFKGKKFEDDVNKLINSAGIKANGISCQVGEESYECDSFFRILDDLYFFECKSFLQPRTPEEYYGLEEKIYLASKQLCRIADFFSKRIDLLREKLGVDDQWNPKNIVKVVITKARLGSPMFIGGCFAIDESVLIRFFQREEISVVGENKVIIRDRNLSGEITNEKLIEYMKSPPQISIVKNVFTPAWYGLQIKKYVFNYMEYNNSDPLVHFCKSVDNIC